MTLRLYISVLLFLLAPLLVLAQETASYSVQVDAEVLQQQGAYLQFEEVSLVVPPSAYSEDTRFILRDRGAHSAEEDAPIPRRFKAESDVYQVKATTGTQSLRLRVSYGTETENRKKVLFLADGATEWEALRTVEHRTDHFVEAILPAFSGKVLLGIHRTKQSRPIKVTNFHAYAGAPYSDTAAVLDVRSGEFLYREEARKQRPIASITKLMTTMVFLESNPNLDEFVTYDSQNDRIGANVNLVSGDVLTLKQVLMATLIPSANNMAMTVSQHANEPSEAEFVQRMNERAAELGLGGTNFAEPTGLDSGNVSTAGNIARLGRVVFQTYPAVFEEAANTTEYEFFLANSAERISFFSTNTFDGRGAYEVTAFKTGYYPGTAERTLILQVRRIGTDHEIIVVLLGNPEYNTIFQEAYSLVDWAFTQWEFHNY